MPAGFGRKRDHPGPGDEQGRAVAPDIAGQCSALRAGDEGLDAPGVDEDILARRDEGQHRADGKGEPDMPGRVGQAKGGDAKAKQALHAKQPAPASAQKGRLHLIENRRP